jgi:hypothetical protein
MCDRGCVEASVKKQVTKQETLVSKLHLSYFYCWKHFVYGVISNYLVWVHMESI